MIAAILLVRRTIVKPAETTLAGDSENVVALNRWRIGYVATFALSEAVALYGVLLRFVGLEFQQVVPFFLAGFILHVVFQSAPSHEWDRLDACLSMALKTLQACALRA